MSNSNPDDTLKIKCSNCSKVIRVPGAMRGKSGKCPGCGNRIRIPDLQSPSAGPDDSKPPERPSEKSPEPDTPEPQATGEPPFKDVRVTADRNSNSDVVCTGIQNLESRAIPVVWLLRITMLIMVVQAYVFWCFSEGERGSDIDTAYEATTIAWWILFVVTGIFFLRWKYQASTNLHGACQRKLKYSPWGCCGYYFLPFANFVFPMNAMHEIQSRSKVEAGYLVYSWWVLLMLSTLIERTIIRPGSATIISGRDWIMLIAVTGIRIVAGLILIKIIKAVTEKQRRYRLVVVV